MSATHAWFGFSESDVWTLFHSYAFDFSVWELWGALLYGGRLEVVPYWVTRSPSDFHALLADCRVTVLNQTPSAFNQLVQAEAEAEAAAARRGNLALRWIVFGGEALDLESLEPWFRRHGDGAGARLVNMYGITETTVHVSFRPVGPEDLAQGRRRPIGMAIPDLQWYLLDARGRLTLPGVSGEIHVGGAGLARGYLGRPGLSAERFLPDGFAGRPGMRLYRTGDLARHRPDGEMSFLGRVDHQVKVRGFRIELGEIESELIRHPAVQEVTVTVYDAEGEKYLTAYLVLRPPDAAAEELRGFLRERLPPYMVPAFFVVLEALPRLPNGKVDRKSLPAPERRRTELEANYVEARTALEARLAEIWCQTLGVERVGVHDNFFELGGDSILSIQVISRAGRAVFAAHSQAVLRTPDGGRDGVGDRAARGHLGARSSGERPGEVDPHSTLVLPAGPARARAFQPGAETRAR